MYLTRIYFISLEIRTVKLFDVVTEKIVSPGILLLQTLVKL